MIPRVVLSAVCAAVLVSACGGAPSSSYPKIARSEFRALVSAPEPTAVLLFDPQDCFTCEAQMGRWLLLRRQRPERVAILLTREPRAAEQKGIDLRRIPVDGILKDRKRQRRGQGPEVVIYRAGNLLMSGRLSDESIHLTLEREMGPP